MHVRRAFPEIPEITLEISQVGSGRFFEFFFFFFFWEKNEPLILGPTKVVPER